MDVMRASIVTGATQDEEGQEREEKAESEKVIHCRPYSGNMFVLGGSMCGKRLWNIPDKLSSESGGLSRPSILDQRNKDRHLTHPVLQHVRTAPFFAGRAGGGGHTPAKCAHQPHKVA